MAPETDDSLAGPASLLRSAIGLKALLIVSMMHFRQSTAHWARMTREAALAIDTKRKIGFSYPPRTVEAPFQMQALGIRQRE